MQKPLKGSLNVDRWQRRDMNVLEGTKDLKNKWALRESCERSSIC